MKHNFKKLSEQETLFSKNEYNPYMINDLEQNNWIVSNVATFSYYVYSLLFYYFLFYKKLFYIYLHASLRNITKITISKAMVRSSDMLSSTNIESDKIGYKTSGCEQFYLYIYLFMHENKCSKENAA